MKIMDFKELLEKSKARIAKNKLMYDFRELPPLKSGVKEPTRWELFATKVLGVELGQEFKILAEYGRYDGWVFKIERVGILIKGANSGGEVYWSEVWMSDPEDCFIMENLMKGTKIEVIN